MKNLFLSAVLLMLANVAQADAIDCNMRIGINGYYHVTLDTESRALKLETRSGTLLAEGVANYSHSSRTNRDFYYVAISYGQGIEVRVRDQEVWACLDEDTCGLCQ